MERILDKLIDIINEHLAEARQSEPLDNKVSGLFKFGYHIIRFSFRRRGCELEIYNPVKDRFLDNVAEFCQARTTAWYNVDVGDSRFGILTDPGFSSEADYLSYKFG